MRISGRRAAILAILMLGTAGSARAADPDARAIVVAATFLEDDQNAAHPAWDLLIPPQAKPASEATQTMILSAYVRRDANGLQAILLVQRNLMPISVGWGPPSACAAHGTAVVATAYRSVRDLLCGWALPVAFATPDSAATLAGPVRSALLAHDALPGVMAQPREPMPSLFHRTLAWSESWLTRHFEEPPEPADTVPQWLLAGWRISDRHDVLDVQLLIRGDTAPSLVRLPLLVARGTRTLGEVWRGSQPGEAPVSGAGPAAAQLSAANLFDGGATQATAKTFFTRTVLTVENWAVAGFALGSNVAGLTMASVLDVYSAAAFWANDYIWDRVSPLRPATQNFVELVTLR